MSKRNIEGTVQFDGLIEGRLPADIAGEIETKLREWVTFAKQVGMTFTLEVDGSTFSLLVDSAPVASGTLGDDPAATVKDALEELLRGFPPPHRTGVFSTLRSSAFQRGVEIQTIYAVVPPGRIEIQERQVAVNTQTPPEPLTTRARVKLGLIGLLVALVIVAVTSLFVDFGQLFDQVRHTITPIDTKQIVVDAQAFAPWVKVDGVTTGTVNRRHSLIIKITRTDAYPQTPEQLNALWREATTIQQHMALQVIASRYIRVEQFDKEGTLIGSSELSLIGFEKAPTIELPIPIPKGHRPTHVRLGY